MEFVSSIKEYMNVPKEHRDEFNKRNLTNNNKVFSVFSVSASAMFGAALFIAHITRDFEDGMAEYEIIRPYYFVIIISCLLTFLILTGIRKYRPALLHVCDTIAAAQYILCFLIFQQMSSSEIMVTGIKNINVMIFGMFVIVFFARFKLSTTLSLLTAVTVFLLIALSTERELISNYFVSFVNLIIAYILASTAACLVWGVQVRNYLWEKNLESLLTSDFLTKVHNRRGFDYLLRRAWDEAVKEHTQLAMLLIDIDLFKNYNDLYGHMEGDKCLEAVADVLASTVRAGDFVARYGGEEFVVIMKDTDTPMAKIVANRMLRAIREKNLPHEASTVCPYVTYSIGGSTIFPANGNTSVQRFIKTVDDAMYKAKQNGRDRAEFLICE